MKRDLNKLTSRGYDLIIVGGGIFGICTAWDAVRRGLSVALVEREDFAGAASANCFKIVHGGLRYLQHGDVIRLRESALERSAFLRIAPHLVKPLPIVVPTYGHGRKGKGIMWGGMRLYDLLTIDRNRGIKDPERRIAHGALITREELLAHFPEFAAHDLTGAAVFHDGQMYSPPRLALAFLCSAAALGVDAANYVETVRFTHDANRITGVSVRDTLTGDEFDIRGTFVVNAAGPWTEPLLNTMEGAQLRPASTFSRDAFFVVPRRFASNYALAVPARTRDPDAILSRETRHLFVVPWREYTLVGVWHVVHRGAPDAVSVSNTDIESFVDEINAGFPGLDLSADEVCMCNAGLVLFGRNTPDSVNLSYGKRSRIIDHGKEHGVEGLLSLIGVRYTTARLEAARVVQLVLKRLGRVAPPSDTDRQPVWGGDMESFGRLCKQATDRYAGELDDRSLRALLHNHGSRYEDVLALRSQRPQWQGLVRSSHTLRAEIVHAVREEMAMTLEDVVCRRTDLGTGGYPGDAALEDCVDVMAAESGWSRQRAEQERAGLSAYFQERSGFRRCGKVETALG